MAQDDRQKLYDMARDVRIAMMTTIETDGSLHVRPMGNREADESGNFWFYAAKDESVARNIAANPQVALGFSDPHANSYVTISGTATLVDDQALIEEKWTPYLEAWFPKGKTDPNIVLVKVDPVRGEYWDSSASIIVNAIGFIKSKLGGGPANDLGDTKKLLL
jgi:general stress protein 26